MAAGTPRSAALRNASAARIDVIERLQEARGGCSVALGELLEECRAYLLLIANRQLDSDLRPKAAASDLVQDTIIAAHQDFERFAGCSQEELLAWVTTILNYRLQNNHRRYRHTKKRSIDRERPLRFNHGESLVDAKTLVESPSAIASTTEEHLRLQRALNELPEDYRLAIEMRTWQRKPYEEIGCLLGRSPEAARKLWSRAIRELAKKLDETQ